MRLTPAAFVIKQFHGIRPLARAVKRAPSTIFRWQTVGYIPTKAQQDILRAAKRRRIDIKPQDLIVGR